MNKKTDFQPTTPLMKQYCLIKEQYPDALLLFQVGDFYELFFSDAQTAARILHITLTKRGHVNGEPIPLCGVPLHALDSYLAKLLKAGYHVVIADQLTDPTPGKLVERAVTRVLTPGTLTDAHLLDEKSSSYLCALYVTQTAVGVAVVELLTGSWFLTTVPSTDFSVLDAQLSRYFPDEIVISDQAPHSLVAALQQRGYMVTRVSAEHETEQVAAARAWMARHGTAATLHSVLPCPELLYACAYLHAYLHRTAARALEQVKQISHCPAHEYLMIDAASINHLELVANSQNGRRENSLLAVLDGATTAMGSRMMKQWLLRPLVQQADIEHRQAAIASFIAEIMRARELRSDLEAIADLERVVGRIALHRATVADFHALKNALVVLPQVKEKLQLFHQGAFVKMIIDSCFDFDAVLQLLNTALNTESSHEWIIARGFDAELDQLRTVVAHSHQDILKLEQHEQQRTGISSLKIRYNELQGYYLEVTKANSARVPAGYVPIQSLVGRDRFMIPELKQLQHTIVDARSRIATVERAVFERVKRMVFQQVSALRHTAYAVAQLDAILGLAKVAHEQRYVCPRMTRERELRIVHGRHPVVERTKDTFIANDISLTEQQWVLVITGPNMGGKSTYLRQVAQICILAHMGSFVPADAAVIPLLDRLFTRIGAADNVAEGKSTFLVEMEETALICQQATSRSLVILDEVGRGTSTFDGLAIAQAVIEFLATRVQPFCLFATHYHELTKLAEQWGSIACYHAASAHTREGMVLLHKIIPGVAHGSFGIEVARLARLPEEIVRRAQEILQHLSAQERQLVIPARAFASDSAQAEYQKRYHELKQKLAQVETSNLEEWTARQALEFVWKLKEELK